MIAKNLQCCDETESKPLSGRTHLPSISSWLSPRLNSQVVTVGIVVGPVGPGQSNGFPGFPDCTKQDQWDGQDMNIGCSCSSMLKGAVVRENAGWDAQVCDGV